MLVPENCSTIVTSCYFKFSKHPYTVYLFYIWWGTIFKNFLNFRVISLIKNHGLEKGTTCICIVGLIMIIPNKWHSIEPKSFMRKWFVFILHLGITEEYREDTEYQHKLNMIEKQCFRNDIHKLVLAALNRVCIIWDSAFILLTWIWNLGMYGGFY